MGPLDAIYAHSPASAGSEKRQTEHVLVGIPLFPLAVTTSPLADMAAWLTWRPLNNEMGWDVYDMCARRAVSRFVTPHLTGEPGLI